MPKPKCHLWAPWKNAWDPSLWTTSWITVTELAYNTATESLGPAARKHKDWFDNNCDDIHQLLNEKHHLHKAYLSDTVILLKKKDLTWSTHCSVQLGTKWSLTRWWSWKVGQSALHPSMLKPLTAFLKCPPTKCWMSDKPCYRPKKQYICSPVAKLLAQTPFQLMSTRKVAQLWLKNSISCFFCCDNRRWSPRSSKMWPTPICKNAKGIAKFVATSEAYACSPLQEWYLPGFCWTVSKHTLTRDLCQRANAASGKIEGPLAWSLLQGNCKRHVSSKSATCSSPLSTWPRSSIVLIEKVCGKSRSSTKVYLHHVAVSWWNGCPSPGKWWDVWPISCHKWCQAWLCFGTHTVQHHVFAMLTDAFRERDVGTGFSFRTDRKLLNIRRL